MATLVLGAAVSSLGLSGFSLFAAQLAVGAIGSFIDSRLFGQSVSTDGPRLNEIAITSSAEGATIKRLFSRMRLGGNIIWTANFGEMINTTTQEGGGKGGGGSVQTSTLYSLSFAVAFCEGNARTTLGRVWADGKLLDTSTVTFEFFPGSATQSVSPTIEGIEGAGLVPAFRGIAYLVFQNLELEPFGNRMPQITAEIIKPLDNPDEDSLENLVEGMNLIPATGEVTYSTVQSVRDDGFGNAVPENIHVNANKTDIELSLEDLTTQFPNNGGVNLVISWFGTDLRASTCTFVPKVEAILGRQLLPTPWSVNGITRNMAQEVSRDDEGRPAFGGTPADFSVVEAMQHLANVNGQDVYFYPFILMDIPPGNGLPDPYGGAEQATYPWRGRITTSSFGVDKTAAAQTEVDSLFGSVAVGDFSVSGTTVTYTGTPGDFGYRRMVFHYAHLCAAAANTLDTPTRFKGFYIGTELRGLTQIRSTAASAATASTTYPGVNALADLFADVRSIFDTAGLTGVLLSYAADWSEYQSHRPQDGSNDVYFNMDAIWGLADCDYIAIDNYFPLSDFRDGTSHADFGTGTVDTYNITSGPFQTAGFPKATSIYDQDYLRGQVEGGENYHYFYGSDADRTNQVRTQVFDTAHNEHWIFRQKDMRNWWAQTHRSRPGGVRDASVVALDNGSGGSAATWAVSSKKFYFSEYGCPAIDKGTNQPNVFFDPKSSESFFPYFSSGDRDDTMQRVYYEATITYWRDNAPTVGPVKLIDPSDMYAWSWDARPYPAFPFREDVWSDAPNYRLGHWLNGRVGVVTLAQLVREICALGGLMGADIDTTGLVNSNSIVRGYVIDSINSPREMLTPLFTSFLFDGFESEGKVHFNLRSNLTTSVITLDDLVIDGGDFGGYNLTRAQETELPGAVRIAFIDEENDYQPGATGGRKLVGSSQNVIQLRFPIVLSQEYARLLGEIIIQESWVARERGEFRLPPSYLALDPSDGMSVTIDGRTFDMRLVRIERGAHLSCSTEGVEPSIYSALGFGGRDVPGGDVPIFGRSILRFLDLPLVTGEEERPWAPRLAAYQFPYPSAVNVNRKVGSGLDLYAQVLQPSFIGVTTAALPRHDPAVFDRVNTLAIKLFDPDANLLSVDELAVLNGSNAVAVQTASGTWEVIQFATATLTGTDFSLPLFDLTTFIRGQLGTETEIADPLPSGQPVVIMNSQTLVPLALPADQKFFTIEYRFGPAELATTSAFHQDVTHTGQSTGLLPYAPTNLKKLPTSGSAEVTFTWLRRTRFDGEDFEAETIPLNEENERYDLEIYDPAGPTLLRTVSNLTVPTYTYTIMQQTSDGGGLDNYLIHVFQKSTTVGRGRMAEATL